MNPAIKKLLDESEIKIKLLDILITDTNNVIAQINSDSGSDTQDVTLTQVSSLNIRAKIGTLAGDGEVNKLTGASLLSDKMVNHGKDILLIADQSEQFICVSNDALSRVIDVFLYINNNSVTNLILPIIEEILLKQQVLYDYLNSRISNTSSSEVDETIAEAMTLNNDVILSNELLTSNIEDVELLIEKSLEVIQTFQNILSVNTSVGVALAVSKRAWSEMEIMNTLEYEKTETLTPMIETEQTVPTIIESTLLNENGLGTWHNRFLKFFPQLFLKNSTLSNDLYDYQIINDVDLITKSSTFSDVFDRLTFEEINLLPRTTSPQLETIFGQIAFISNVDTSDVKLQQFYDEIVGPNISFDEFKASFTSPAYLEIISKFTDGINSLALDEYIESYHKKLQYTMLKDTLENYSISDAPKYSHDMVVGETLFIGDTYNNAFSHYQNQFLREAFAVYKGTLSYYNLKISLNEEYRDLRIPNSLVIEEQSGSLKIKQFKDKKLLKNISQLDYKYKIYRDNIKIYYIEASMNNVTFLIKNDLLTLAYKIETEENDDLEFVSKQERDIISIYNIDGYLTTGENYNHILNLVKLTEDNIFNLSKKVHGVEIEKNIHIETLYNEINDEYNVIKQVTSKETDTTFITEDPIVRISTNITNVYRTELIEGRMDFPQARVKSIISTLRHLGYRKLLDNFIDLTWNMNVPHPKRI